MNAISPDRVYTHYTISSSTQNREREKKRKIHTHTHTATVRGDGEEDVGYGCTAHSMSMFEVEHSIRTKSNCSTICVAFRFFVFSHALCGYNIHILSVSFSFPIPCFHTYTRIQRFCSTQTINYRSFCIVVRLEHFTYYIK